MKKKKGGKNTFLFILIILAFALLVTSFYFIVIKHKNPFSGWISGIVKKEEINDNYNGIYTYVEEMGGTFPVFQNCTVQRVQNYLLVKGEKYYAYRSTCMGTYYKNEGDTKNLTITLSEDKSTYVINYNNHNYVKDTLTAYIRPNNPVVKNLISIDLSSLQLLVNETEFEGNEYNINRSTIKNNNILLFSLDIYKKYILIEARVGKEIYMVYDYMIDRLDHLPIFYTYGNNLAIIERDDNIYDSNKFAYILSFVGENGKTYDLRDYFPISVDNVKLSYEDNSIFVKFDPISRDYILLIGKDKKMCEEKFDPSKGDEIAYYEFIIDYNYLAGGFETPVFKDIGYKSEGCKYVNSIIGGEE